MGTHGVPGAVIRLIRQSVTNFLSINFVLKLVVSDLVFEKIRENQKCLH